MLSVLSMLKTLIKHKDYDIIRMLFDRGRFNKQDYNEMFWIALEKNNVEFLKMLDEIGVLPANLIGSDLSEILEHDSVDVLQYYIEVKQQSIGETICKMILNEKRKHEKVDGYITQYMRQRKIKEHLDD